MAKPTGYEYSRRFWDFCFCNPEKITPTHIALYFFAIEHCNRLGWKEKFGLPTEMAKDAIHVKSWHTYMKAFNDLVEFGFFELVEKSRNQYSSNIIALIKNDEALDEALDKAISKHYTKQRQSNDSIDKQYSKPLTNTEPLTTKPKHNFLEAKEIYSKPYIEHTDEFKKQHTEYEYNAFKKFIDALYRDFTVEELSINFDRCVTIGKWKRHLHSKPFMILKPAIEKAISSKEGNREEMELRIKTFTNGLFDEKVFTK